MDDAKWAEDNKEGRELALRTIEHMRLIEAPNYLGAVVREMIEAGQYGGREVGFFHMLAVLLM